MSTVALKNTMVMNNTEKKAGLVSVSKNIFWIMQRFLRRLLQGCLEMVMRQHRS